MVRGGIAVYHWDMGWKMKLDLGLEMWTSDLSFCFEREPFSLVIRAMIPLKISQKGNSGVVCHEAVGITICQLSWRLASLTAVRKGWSAGV